MRGLEKGDGTAPFFESQKQAETIYTIKSMTNGHSCWMKIQGKPRETHGFLMFFHPNPGVPRFCLRQGR